MFNVFLFLEKLHKHFSVENQPKLIKITPWITIDGKINGTALKKWCGIVLSYCLKNPKVHFKALTKKFCYLKPVDIFSILEVHILIIKRLIFKTNFLFVFFIVFTSFGLCETYDF